MSSYPANRFYPANYVVNSAVGGDAAAPAAGDVTRPAEETPNARANVINNVCKGTLCPDHFTSSPVAKNYPQVTKVQMKESTTIKVLPPYAGNVGSQASADPSTGIVLVNWKEGPSGGIYHMGILPANSAWSYLDTYDPGLKNALTFGLAPVAVGAQQLVLNKALALPYNKSSLKQIRLTSTNLAQNFTRSRYYSGRITIVSDTVQLNAAVAAGNVSASVITESEGVAQNASGDDCYSVSDIVNGARWKPETVQGHNLMDGVTILQGPDIIEEMPPVDQINRNRTDGAWTSLAATIGWNQQKTSVVALAPNITSGVVTAMWGTWISPCGVNCGTTFANNYLFGNAYNNAYFDPIPEMQMVSVRIKAPYHITLPGSWQSDSNFRSWVVCEHFFGSLNANGQLVIQTIADIQTVGDGSITSLLLGPGSTSNFRLSDSSVGIIDIVSDPRAEYVRRRNSGNDPGKYLGTQAIQYFATYNQVGGDSPITFKIGAQDTGVGSAAAESIFEVCAVSLNTEQSGPFTVIRYDEVAVGQNIRVNSIVNTENVSKSALSVISPTDVYDVCYDINIYALLNSLYFGPHTDFRCCWTNSNYRKLLAKIMNWRLADLIQATVQSPRTMQIAEAAGLFDGLKTFGRGLLGLGRSAIANPMVRQLARNALDGAIAHIPHPIGRELVHHAVDGAIRHFGNNDVVSQDGTTDAQARGYFGDQNWVE